MFKDEQLNIFEVYRSKEHSKDREIEEPRYLLQKWMFGARSRENV